MGIFKKCGSNTFHTVKYGNVIIQRVKNMHITISMCDIKKVQISTAQTFLGLNNPQENLTHFEHFLFSGAHVNKAYKYNTLLSDCHTYTNQVLLKNSL